MSRLIDRSKLKMEIKKWLKPSAADESTMVALDDIAISVLMTIEEQPLVKAIPLEKVKQARKEIENINPVCSTIGNKIPVLKNCDDIKTEVLEILDKLIEGGTE